MEIVIKHVLTMVLRLLLLLIVHLQALDFLPPANWMAAAYATANARLQSMGLTGAATASGTAPSPHGTTATAARPVGGGGGGGGAYPLADGAAAAAAAAAGTAAGGVAGISGSSSSSSTSTRGVRVTSSSSSASRDWQRFRWGGGGSEGGVTLQSRRCVRLLREGVTWYRHHVEQAAAASSSSGSRRRGMQSRRGVDGGKGGGEEDEQTLLGVWRRKLGAGVGGPGSDAAIAAAIGVAAAVARQWSW